MTFNPRRPFNFSEVMTVLYFISDRTYSLDSIESYFQISIPYKHTSWTSQFGHAIFSTAILIKAGGVIINFWIIISAQAVQVSPHYYFFGGGGGRGGGGGEGGE